VYIDENELVLAQMRAIKEHNQQRVKTLVAAVGITLTVICFLLVGLSLAFGHKIDKLGGSI
jgi:hypothetical protein